MHAQAKVYFIIIYIQDVQAIILAGEKHIDVYQKKKKKHIDMQAVIYYRSNFFKL